MNKTKMLYAGVAGGLMLGSLTLGTANAKPAPAPKAPELTLLKDVTWTPLMKEAPLPALATIQGDPTKGAYTAYIKFASGFEGPTHAHTNDYWAVLVQGKMTHWAANGGSEKDAKQLGVGDLTFMPGKVEHVSKCYAGTDCIIMVVQKGKHDFVPAKAVAKKEEKPATTPATGSEKSGPATATAAAPAAAPAATATAKAPASAPAAPAAKVPAAAPAAPAAKVPAAAPAAAPAPAVPAPAKK